ncbi:uncharacterized protein LOC127792837 [Diospyros lotus]|uniref:uncharacterized protein LOC127792837 n=1 Tax=Diospyros lotus TaxID=55363 RepID=UPI0022501E1C|nr:uncharacterized protein LOC127792837 [Diospyros lotus]
MATARERSRPLHNFALPPRLKWGQQRFLRCMKVTNSNGDDHRSLESDGSKAGIKRSRSSSSIAPDTLRRSSPLKPISGGDCIGIEAVRQKLLLDLRVAADKMKVSILEEKELEDLTSAARPWNLRTRRAACKAPTDESSGGGGHRKVCNSPESQAPAPAKPSRLRGAAGMGSTAQQQSPERTEKGPRAKFSVSLSREEVERDFLSIAGIRPPRRPKKRPKIVQKQLDTLFPGLWLTEITADIYKVPDIPEPGKG